MKQLWRGPQHSLGATAAAQSTRTRRHVQTSRRALADATPSATEPCPGPLRSPARLKFVPTDALRHHATTSAPASSALAQRCCRLRPPSLRAAWPASSAMEVLAWRPWSWTTSECDVMVSSHRHAATSARAHRAIADRIAPTFDFAFASPPHRVAVLWDCSEHPDMLYFSESPHSDASFAPCAAALRPHRCRSELVAVGSPQRHGAETSHKTARVAHRGIRTSRTAPFLKALVLAQ